jgi:hypothetical protein
MRIDDIICPCGSKVELGQTETGWLVWCAAECDAVDAPEASSPAAALEAFLGAEPPPPATEALACWAHQAARVLALTPPQAEAVQFLAPVGRLLFELHQADLV